MRERFGIDLRAFSLESLHDLLAHSDLLPSHQVLREDLDARFATLVAHGITSAQQIVDALTTKVAVARVAEKTGIPEDYLTILRRHVRGYIPTPITFAEIPGLDPQVVEALTGAGIKHTQHFFDRACGRVERADLARQLGLSDAVADQLLRLTDLSRLGWVGPIGARLFLEAGAHSVEVLRSLDLDAFYACIQQVNAERRYTKATITRRDVALIQQIARRLPLVIEY